MSADLWAGMGGGERRGPVEVARLVWAARAEASRLHRLRADAAHHQRVVHRALAEQDARIYRCPGCGDWRYRTGHTGGRVRNSSQRLCPCGYREAKGAAA